MEIFLNHILDWVILVGLLAGAFYTMKIIGREKSTFREESYEVQFEDLLLYIPNWWTITEQQDHGIKFERTDTRYDWYANYKYISHDSDKDLPLLLEDILNEQKIEFDQDVVFETDSRVLFRDEDIQREFQEVIRVEGKASEDVNDRIYYDIYLMKRLNRPGYFIFESKSSVLNGLVEGPYFEESLSELSFIRES